MAYVFIGDQFVDSEEVFEVILKNSNFKKVKDFTKGSKREDTLVFQIIQDINKLKDGIEENSEEVLDEEELIEELMTRADREAYAIEEFMPEYSVSYVYSYRYDEGLEEIRTIVVTSDENIGGLRLRDVAERILKSVD